MRTENRRPDTTKLMVAFRDFANALETLNFASQRLSVRLSASSNSKTNKRNQLRFVLNKIMLKFVNTFQSGRNRTTSKGTLRILITFKVLPVKYLLQRKMFRTEFPETNLLLTLRAIRFFLYPQVLEIIYAK
jgi:hypothetical protein